MSRIAIIAALPGELKPLVRGWKRAESDLWTGQIAGHEAIAIAGGMGAAAAARAVNRVFAKGKPRGAHLLRMGRSIHLRPQTTLCMRDLRGHRRHHGASTSSPITPQAIAS